MPSRPAARLGAVISAVALTAAGCGTGASAGPEEKVHATVATLLTECAAGTAPEILHLLTVPAQRAFVAAEGARQGCDAVLKLSGADSDPALREAFEQARVDGVRVEGDIAYAEIVAPPARRSLVEAEYTRGDWRITSFPLP